MPAKAKATSTEEAIRPLRAEDAPELAAIVLASPGAADWSLESYEKLARSPEYVSLVHESEGRITGFVFGRYASEEAEVMNLAVRPEQRRGGIGGKLLDAALRAFQGKGVARVYLEVRESNLQARSFYRNRGFVQSGLRPNYYHKPEEAAVVMEKKLTG